jgi:hypothetical protein
VVVVVEVVVVELDVVVVSSSVPLQDIVPSAIGAQNANNTRKASVDNFIKPSSLIFKSKNFRSLILTYYAITMRKGIISGKSRLLGGNRMIFERVKE